MKFIPVKTRSIIPPKDNIYPILDKYLPKLREKDVVFITSKIIAIHQGRTVLKEGVDKNELIKKEADFVFKAVRQKTPRPTRERGRPSSVPSITFNGVRQAFRNGREDKVVLTIKNNTIIPQAGIDESNGGDYYILWPQDPNNQAKEICKYLKKKYDLKKLGVVITDSHLLPFRWGTSGISIGFYGIEPTKDYRGKKDIFGRKMEMTKVNVVDSISNMAVLHMGEGNNKQPIVIGMGLDFVKFTNRDKSKDFIISKEEDVFGRVFN